MKVARVPIACLMVFIGIVALNFGAMRRLSGFTSEKDTALALGAMPMANVLAVGVLALLQRRGSPAFLVGFETFGVIVLALYVTWARQSPEESVSSYVHGVFQLVANAFGAPRSVVSTARFIPTFVFVLVSPQLAIALLGGFLFHTASNAERPDHTHD